MLIFVLGQWAQASVYGFEPPLVALLLGLVISNLVGLPRRLDAGFRVEFYIKTGIVLLGATLPFTLIVWAGPVAILQASIVSLSTFFVDLRRRAQARPRAAFRGHARRRRRGVRRVGRDRDLGRRGRREGARVDRDRDW